MTKKTKPIKKFKIVSKNDEPKKENAQENLPGLTPEPKLVIEPSEKNRSIGKRIPFSEYLAVKRVSSHSMMDFIKSPKLYKRKQDGIAPSISSSSMSFGTACHVFIIEGDEEFNRIYEVGGPVNDKTGKPYGSTTAKFKEYEEKSDKKIISKEDHQKIMMMDCAVRENHSANTLLNENDGEAELSLFETIGGIDCKMRLDWWCESEDVNVDLKTCRNLDDFESDFWKYQYDVQVGMFALIMNEIIDHVPDFAIVAVEKQEPYRCRTYHMSPKTINSAANKVSSGLFDLHGCIEDDRWVYGTEVDGVI